MFVVYYIDTAGQPAIPQRDEGYTLDSALELPSAPYMIIFNKHLQPKLNDAQTKSILLNLKQRLYYFKGVNNLRNGKQYDLSWAQCIDQL